MITVLAAILISLVWFGAMLHLDWWYRDKVRGWDDSIIGTWKKRRTQRRNFPTARIRR